MRLVEYSHECEPRIRSQQSERSHINTFIKFSSVTSESISGGGDSGSYDKEKSAAQQLSYEWPHLSISSTETNGNSHNKS